MASGKRRLGAPRSFGIQQGAAEIRKSSAFPRWGIIVASYRLLLAMPLLGCLLLGGTGRVDAMLPSDQARLAPLLTDAGLERTEFAQAQPAPSPAPQAPAAPAPATPDEPIGNVATLTGTATVIRNKDSIALKLKDDIFFNDTVQTSSGASLGITFNDATTFHLSENARVTIDSYVYEEGGSKNSGIFGIGKGTVAFVAAALAETGNMQINTPTATLGIRGTTGLVEVPEGAAAASANNVNIKLYPDADGRVGRIEVNDRQGARLGTLTQGASGFAIRPGAAGARAAAVPLTISPQQAARDQGIVRQVHATQTVGRQIVTEQRAIRRANPPGAQPQQRPPGQPGRQQPGTPKGPAQPGTPKGEKKTQDTPKGEKQTQGTPQTPAQPAMQPRPGGQQPGAQRPQQQRPKPPPPPKKKKR